MLRAIAPSGAKVSVRAGHGTGKTTALAIIIWWHLECFDYCKIPCTAPTASQLRLVLWSELNKTLRRADEQASKDGLAKAFWLSNLFKITQDRIYDPSPQSEWFAVARTARREQPDALQGFHASNVDITADDTAVQRASTGETTDHDTSLLFVVDESSGVPDEIFEVAEGALSSEGSRLILVGNPVRNTGFFARSHRENARDFTPLHFSTSDSPLVPASYREGLVRRYGEGSNVVRVRADGEFPKQDDDVLIAFEWTEAAYEREPYADDGSKRILGVDPARFGDDRTVFVLRAGKQIKHIEVHSKDDTMVTAGRALAIARKFNVDAIHVDVIGIGAGVVDRLEELRNKEHEFNIVPVNVADAATLKPVTNDKRGNMIPGEKFGRQDMIPKAMKEYLWLEMCEWFANDEPSLVDANVDWGDHAKDLSAECSTVRYKFDSSGKIVIESKDELKKRDVRSPDIAEALACTFSPNRMSIWERLCG